MSEVTATAPDNTPHGIMARRVPAFIALGCIFLQIPGRLLPALAALAIWLVCLALCDRQGLLRMARPRFWIVSLVLAVACGLLLGRRDTKFLGMLISSSGMQSGLLMVVRGAFIFGLSIWASRALSGITRARLGRRSGRLTGAVGAAFRLLPELGERLRCEWRAAPPKKGRLRRIGVLAADMLVHTARIAEQAAQRATASRGRLLVAVLGPPDSGKTTTIREIADRLRGRRLAVAGVSQPKDFRNGSTLGYNLRDEASGENRSFAVPNPSSGRQDLTGYKFDPGGWLWARELISSACGSADVVIVDELGSLEAAGKGHMPALMASIRKGRCVWLVGVRKGFERAIQQRTGPFSRIICAGTCGADLDALIAWLYAIRPGQVKADILL
ncbi:MAG TPA: nucleoside-triphosphatase [Myxococcota bacterium]|nr:nucleoside-triphosphatase [Myxococcota bacterium]